MAESEISTWAEEIERKLMAADVSRNLAEELKRSVLKTVEDGTSARKYSPKMIEKAIAGEVIKLLDRGLTHFKPEKSTPSIVMFVGLPGSGKTTTVAKYAQFHQDEGFKVAIVCADTVGIDALSQIKNLANPGIFIYGSANEYDSAKVAVDGITKSISHKCDLVLIDTSGCGKQDAALFDAVRKVAKETNPDLVVLVWDSTNSSSEASYEEAAAFKESVGVGAVMLTKMEGYAMGTGALRAVEGTDSPVTFIGTGTRLDQLEAFNAKSYVRSLFGSDVTYKLLAPGILVQLSQSDLTFRIMKYLLQNILDMGPLKEILFLEPVVLAELMARGSEKEGLIKGYLALINSMTPRELDSSVSELFFSDSRKTRLSIGAGRMPGVIEDSFTVRQKLQKLSKSILKLKVPEHGEEAILSRHVSMEDMLSPALLELIHP